MKPISDVICVVHDRSKIFLPIAVKLAEQCKQVYWVSPSNRDTVKDGTIGDGFDNIERVDEVWDVKKNCDLFVYPDIGLSGEQLELESQGLAVWGARKADSLEMKRGKFLNVLKELGLNVPKYVAIQGMSALRQHLKGKTDKWVKVDSCWRGDIETFHWRDWSRDETTLDYHSFKLGPFKDMMTFYVFDPLVSDIEDGVDTYCVNGQLPTVCMHGMEAKNKSYLSTISKFADIPEEVRHVTEAFAPVLAEYGYRSFFSSEVRIVGDKSYFIDSTCRAGSPPHQVMTELYSNLGEIIWAGANGECIDPEPAAEFGAQVLLKSDSARDAWSVTTVPEKLRQWIKFGGSCQVDDRICTPPDESGTSDVGWLVAIDDSIEGVIKTLKGHSKELPDGLSCDCASLAELIDEIKEAESAGMEFTDQSVPEPAIVIEDA